ncbi:hypothetical protein K443DRAFT_476945 [Laccaria amethystina LaAM-08-1]|uniref:Unplaced genomic scaffold K443scaffold_45, whole genome shotgun sequence n=1 Tax=Laccaria amethystina LaAM-08-1 TaxID=1095629 RepID=A0A0C9WVF4_9AGAR|nr:hypothetical protein K443DRAFT_476945 [Laccaria amethystina LaAM-08-1]
MAKFARRRMFMQALTDPAYVATYNWQVPQDKMSINVRFFGDTLETSRSARKPIHLRPASDGHDRDIQRRSILPVEHKGACRPSFPEFRRCEAPRRLNGRVGLGARHLAHWAHTFDRCTFLPPEIRALLFLDI